MYTYVYVYIYIYIHIYIYIYIYILYIVSYTYIRICTGASAASSGEMPARTCQSQHTTTPDRPTKIIPAKTAKIA